MSTGKKLKMSKVQGYQISDLMEHS